MRSAGITWIKRGLVSLPIVLAGMQFVPYGRSHTNGEVVAEPAWDVPRTRELAVRACFDCHSNETAWPWYSNIAPVSWLVQHDVNEGRETLNFSQWQREQPDAHEAGEEVEAGEMPPGLYRWVHGAARLSAAERSALIKGLNATPGTGGGAEAEH